MIYTGYVDSELEPIKVGDFMASPSEKYIGYVMETKYGFLLSYGDTNDTLKSVANEYHIVTEDYANYLYDLKYN